MSVFVSDMIVYPSAPNLTHNPRPFRDTSSYVALPDVQLLPPLDCQNNGLRRNIRNPKWSDLTQVNTILQA